MINVTSGFVPHLNQRHSSNNSINFGTLLFLKSVSCFSGPFDDCSFFTVSFMEVFGLISCSVVIMLLNFFWKYACKRKDAVRLSI